MIHHPDRTIPSLGQLMWEALAMTDTVHGWCEWNDLPPASQQQWDAAAQRRLAQLEHPHEATADDT